MVVERGLEPAERRFVTPEGIDLRIRLASRSQRFAAFAIDALLLIAVLTILTIALGLLLIAVGARGIEVAAIVWLSCFFFLRNGYFIACELGDRAATIGKRLLGIRVIAKGGGRLTGDAVIARNLMRELEIFLPLSFLGYQANQGAGEALTAIFGLIWAALFAFLPLFNRDRLRAGDLIAGTWVIDAPRAALGRNLVAVTDKGTVRFTDAQLDAYGVFELHTLERILRTGDVAAQATVADAIRAKIAWPGAEPDAEFLDAYYSALRLRLERGLLFGRRRANKHDRKVPVTTDA